MSEKQGSYTTRAKTIFRTMKNEENPFVMMDRRPLENKTLSWGAKGVLAYLLSRPDNWIVRLRDLVNRSTDGVYKIRGYLKELNKAGHLLRREERDENTGRITQYILEVYELPFTTKPLTNLPQAVEQQAVNLTFNDTDSNDTEFKYGVPPNFQTSLEWKLGHDQPVNQHDLEVEKDRKMQDAANLIAMTFGISAPQASALSLEFMRARDIVIPEGKIKGQRKAVKEMLEMKVEPRHIREAVDKLVSADMTVVDLFAVSKTACDLANKPKTEEPPAYKPYVPKEGNYVPQPAGLKPNIAKTA